MKLQRKGNPNKVIEVTEDEFYTLANGGQITKPGFKSPIYIDKNSKLTEDYLLDGENITPEMLKKNAVETRGTSWVDKATGWIPTLSDVGNRIVQGIGTLTGQIENPFEGQIKEVEAQLRTATLPQRKKELEAQLKTLREISKGWSGYEVAKNDDVSAAPGFLQGVHKVAKAAGDNIDVVDVGTAFLPVGLATKGAALVGKKLPLAGKMVTKGIEEGAKFAEKHKKLGKVGEVARDAADQALIEGAHGAVTYKPEENEYMLPNALEQGGLAGIIQGGVSALGGGRYRAIKALPENARVERGLEGLRVKGINVPEYSPAARAGGTALTEHEAEALIADEIEKANKVIEGDIPVTEGQLFKAIQSAQNEMLKPKYGEVSYNDMLLFKKPEGQVRTRWDTSIRSRLPEVQQINDPRINYRHDDVYSLKDILAAAYSKPYVQKQVPRIGESVARDVEAEAGQLLGRNILKEVGIDAEKAAEIEKHLANAEELRGLAGIKYASKPLERVSEKPVTKTISQVPLVRDVPRIYESQTLPTVTKGDLGALYDRAINNVFLDFAREAGENRLDYLDDRYKK